MISICSNYFTKKGEMKQKKKGTRKKPEEKWEQ